jgi:hypothetical protein
MMRCSQSTQSDLFLVVVRSCPAGNESGKGLRRQGARHVPVPQWCSGRVDIGKNSFHVVGWTIAALLC